MEGTKFGSLKDADKLTTVPLMKFEKEHYLTKTGKTINCHNWCNFEFYSTVYGNISLQRSSSLHQLRNYQSTTKEFNTTHDVVVFDIDFSENLTLPIKFEFQSTNWSHDHISVYPGILK